MDPHLSVMCLCVKDQFPVNLSTMLTFSEADLPAVNLFICCFMTGSRCAVCVTHALILWPLSLAFLFVCLGFFSLCSLQLLLFYLGYVSLLLFISKEAVNVQVWDSVSLLPADVPKFTRSLLPLFILAFASKANLFTSLASKWLESMATNSVFFESSTTSIFLVFAFARFLSFVVIVSHCICGEISPVLLQSHALLLHHA